MTDKLVFFADTITKNTGKSLALAVAEERSADLKRGRQFMKLRNHHEDKFAP